MLRTSGLNRLSEFWASPSPQQPSATPPPSHRHMRQLHLGPGQATPNPNPNPNPHPNPNPNRTGQAVELQPMRNDVVQHLHEGQASKQLKSALQEIGTRPSP